MALKLVFCSASVSFWEVDGSGLCILYDRASSGRKYWVESCPRLPPAKAALAQEYLSRHGLNKQLFSSRARVLDALRLALSSEPHTRARPQTQWRKQADGLYLSRDGHWQLQRTAHIAELRPQSPAAEAGLREDPHPPLLNSLCLFAPSPLYMCALHADGLNQELGLSPPASSAS